MILPGATLGLLGGGQLGRMFTVAARTMGYEVIVLDPDVGSPAGAFATEHLCAAYNDEAALVRLATECAAVTTEFENVPATSLEIIAQHIPVRPSATTIHIARDRILEKQALRDFGLDTVDYYVIENDADLEVAIEAISFPAILKTATLGYDGKGQKFVVNATELVPAFHQLGSISCVLEQFIELSCEVSVVLARSVCGHIESFAIAENRHTDGILDMSIVPARVNPEIAARAEKMARILAEELDYCGVLAVEFFVDVNDRLMINEIAPRPHNSGHYTLDACLTDQFQQQVRTLCGFKPGKTDLTTPAVMVNILGDLWSGGTPAWDALLNYPGVFLHLYGKKEPIPGRKMGHFTLVGNAPKKLLETAALLKKALGQSNNSPLD
ncbi:MAG TPA: 5-(carboxyamino)imidazole ribonucleotide synthase [Gammaproteobacteria bacterium]|nr:N5-carboxyaminoimidazole ribonucleotide synthase [bacterium BMS3Abin11]HDH08215.1 5-(carboxyamino)imidazole ribonucleotide synthase [Gammaproteobacteria bacterium]HDH15735.1 5-(carboxyamino)imidazole ribonucleotide synthase [Gammaproteobacteria bacterium]HDZ78426.1 5-(carboxyamino)imidazole ribonucleotide synthase [Gammaproteobacteria bacterium]